jgi:hypothetical protein
MLVSKTSKEGLQLTYCQTLGLFCGCELVMVFQKSNELKPCNKVGEANYMGNQNHIGRPSFRVLPLFLFFENNVSEKSGKAK